MNDEKKKESIGALWLKVGRSGIEYMSGMIEMPPGVHTEVVGFKNDKGGNPKRPDWRLYPSDPRPLHVDANNPTPDAIVPF